MSRLFNDNFDGVTLRQGWHALQPELLTTGWTVGSGYLQASVDTHVHTYNNEIGCCLGQPLLRPATGRAFDVVCELEAFNETFTDVPAAGAPRIVAIGWWRPQFTVTGVAAGGGLTASDIQDSHQGVGRAPGMSGGTGIVREYKRTSLSFSDWNTVAGASRAWCRLRAEDNTLYYFIAESVGAPGAGAIPGSGDWTQTHTADISAMGAFGYCGPRLYTNTDGVGGRWYRFLDYSRIGG